MKKRVLGVVLSVIMLISLVSTAAFACDSHDSGRHHSKKECSEEQVEEQQEEQCEKDCDKDCEEEKDCEKDCDKDCKEDSKEDCDKDCGKDCDKDCGKDCDEDCGDDYEEWIPDLEEIIDWLPDWFDCEECEEESSDPSVYFADTLVPAYADLVYTGLSQYPVVSLANDNGETIDADDYVVIFDPEVESINVGSYDFLVVGTHPLDICSKVVGYGGYVYNIVARDIADPNIAASIESPFYYTSEAITPVPSFVNGWTGAALVEGVDFEIVGYENNIEVGTATVTVNGIGNYTGTTTLSFEIIPNEYKFTKGDGQSITKERGAEGVFETNGNVNFFEGLEVDGTLLEQGKDYLISGNENGTVITLRWHALKNLKTGKHTIEAIYHDGSCSGTFSLAEGVAAPKTSGTTNLIIWISAFAAAFGGAAVAVSRRRRFN